MSPFERGFIKGCGQAGLVGGILGVGYAFFWLDGWAAWGYAGLCGWCALVGWLTLRQLRRVAS